MAKRELPSIDDLRARVIYNPQTGEFRWRERPVSDFREVRGEPPEVRARQWNSRCADKVAFNSTTKDGYKVGHFRAKLLYAHRVAFAIMEGRWPKVIDHRNGERSDNRWRNLKEVTARENTMNNRCRSDSATGRTGVKPNRRKGRGYIANIKHKGRLIHLGTFDKFSDAVKAREDAEKNLGFSIRHGV